jgi:hypothetical protein
MSEIGNMHESLRLMPDFQMREMAEYLSWCHISMS